MINFFKNFGKGILYIFVLPFLAVALAGYAVVALFVFIFLAIKGLVLFFTGRSLYEDLPEDKEAKKRLGIYEQKEFKEEPTTGANVEQYLEPKEEDDISNDPFYVPEYLKTQEQKEEVQDFEDEPEIENELEEDPKPEADVFETPLEEERENIEPKVEEEKKKPEDVISVEKTVQNDSILEISDIEDDEDDSDSGINIDFN